MIRTTTHIAAAVALTLSFNLARDADAALLLEFSESDGNVILEVSGSLDLTGLAESNKGAALGGTILLDTVNEQLQIGSGTNAPVNAFTLTVQNEVFSSATNLFGTVDSWTSNTNSIRFQQNNGQFLVDDAIESGNTITVTSTHTFSDSSFADFGLTEGDNIVWLENTNIVSGDAGQVIVAAVSDPGPTPPFPLTITPAGSGYQLTWASQDGMIYNLWKTADLSEDLADWDLEKGNIAPSGTGTNTENVTPTEAVLFYRVEETPPPALFEEDFETDDGDFTAIDKIVGGTGTDWAHGPPDSNGLGGFVTEGNDSSANCWGTNLGSYAGGTGNPGFYADPTDTCLRSAIINLSGVTAAELTFAQALDLANGDSVIVNIIDDTTDDVIASNIVTITDTDLNNADWESVGPVAIPAAALGQAVRLEWCLSGSGGPDDDYMGWYIDDVVVQDTSP